MNRAIIWKELREQGVIAIALAVLGIGVIVALSLFIKPVQSGVNVESYVFNPGFVGVLAMVIVAGLVVGGSLFAAERENGTQAYFDLLPVSRARKWLGKTLGGLILVLPISLMFASIGAVVGLLGPTKTLPLVAFFVLILALQMYGWGMVGSSFSRSSLTAASWGVFLAVVCTVILSGLTWLIIGVFFNIPIISQSRIAAEILSYILIFILFLVPWIVSYFIYTNPDAERKRRAIVGERQRVLEPGQIPVKPRLVSLRFWRVAPMFRAAFWQARRQSMGLGVVFTLISLALGGLMFVPGTPVVVIWPVLSFLITVIVGVLLWKHEQDTGAQRFWIERRFPLSRLWASKLVVGLLIMLTCTLAMALPFGIVGTFFNRRLQLELPSDLIFSYDFNLFAYLLLWPIYGFVFGFVIGPLFRKPAVALAVAMMVGATAAAVWLPSFFVGGVHLWQLFLAPVLALLVSRWLLWPYAAEQLPKPKYLQRIAIGAAVILLGTTLAIGYRAWELPDNSSRTADLDYATQKIPSFDDNIGGREIRRASSLLGPKFDSGNKLKMPVNMLQYSTGEYRRNNPHTLWMDDVRENGWHATPEQDEWLTQMMEGGWLDALDQSTTLPMGVVEDPTEMNLGKTLLHLKGLDSAATLVSLHALRAQANGKPEEFVRCLRVLLHAARTLRNQGVMASHQLALQVESTMLNTLRHWLVALAGRDDLLRQVDQLLVQHNKFFSPQLYLDMRMAEQRALRNTFISPAELLNAFNRPDRQLSTEQRTRWDFEQELVGFAWQVPWEKERMQRFLSIGNEREYTRADFNLMRGLPNLQSWYLKLQEQDLAPTYIDGIGIEIDLCRMLVALRRYELKNQKLPGKLEELVPAFLPELPSRAKQEYRLDVLSEDVELQFRQRQSAKPISIPKGRAVLSNIGAPEVYSGRWEVSLRVRQFVYVVHPPAK